MLDKAAFRVLSKFKAVKRIEGGFHVVGKFKSKKKLDSGNTVYVYSERQVADRNRKKAKRLEKLTKSIKSLRAQVKRDLTSSDSEKALTALAVGLMDETAERVGSDASAKGDLNEDGEPHFGVTTWTRKHITFGKGGATIKYTGKSGVKHVKKIKDAGLVKALKKAYDACEKGDDNCIFGGEKAIKAKHVNQYLKTFSITAKDLRGFHANHGMREALKAVRSKGGKLPSDKKEREKKLKAEWKKALAEVAEDIGHEPATLSNQYLVPGLEDSYLKDGTVIDKLTKTATVLVQREPYEDFYPATDCFPPPEQRPDVAYPTTEWNIDKHWDGTPLEGDDFPLVDKTAASITLDGPWVDKMRKDFLTLLKNVPRVKNYAEAHTLSKALHTYGERFDELFFVQFLNKSLKYEETSLSDQDRSYIDQKLRKVGWSFYIELGPPILPADAYYSEEARFAQWEQEKDRWSNRLKTKARAFWTDMNETIRWYERIRMKWKDDPEKIRVTTPDIDQLTLSGFRARIKGYDPSVSYMPSALEQVKWALEDYRQKAKQRLPILLQKQLPLIIDFGGDLSTGGSYHGQYIWLNATSAIGSKDTATTMTKTLAHEMGHHIFKSVLSKEATELWYALIRGDYGDLDLRELLQKWPDSVTWAFDFSESLRESDPILSLQVATVSEGYQPGGFAGRGLDKREDFQAMLDKGETKLRVPQTPITGYAGKNSEEAFCETVGLLVAYGPRAVHEKIRSWLDVVLPGQVKLAQVEAYER